MISLPAASSKYTAKWLGPWPAEKKGYKNVNIFQTTMRAGGVMLFIEGPKDGVKRIAEKCKNVSVLDSVDSDGTPNAAYVKGDLFEFIEIVFREGFLMKPLMEVQRALYELLPPPTDAAHDNALRLAKRRWGAAQIHESIL